jgi:hypothetical protein
MYTTSLYFLATFCIYWFFFTGYIYRYICLYFLYYTFYVTYFILIIVIMCYYYMFTYISHVVYSITQITYTDYITFYAGVGSLMVS